MPIYQGSRPRSVVRVGFGRCWTYSGADQTWRAARRRFFARKSHALSGHLDALGSCDAVARISSAQRPSSPL